MDMSTAELEAYLAGRSRDFHQLLAQEAVVPHLQPVVAVASGKTVGYEVLSRGAFEGAKIPAAELFSVAEQLGLEQQLSRLCRRQGMEVAETLDGEPQIFLNTHPTELGNVTELISSLTELRKARPGVRVVLEMHEAAAAATGTVKELRHELDQLGYRLAFDDFGAGRSRLQQIADAPPHYLKFDKGLVHKVDSVKERFRLLSSLVPVVRAMGIEPIAEGVETEAEAAACDEMGFDLAQGFHFGFPEPVG